MTYIVLATQDDAAPGREVRQFFLGHGGRWCLEYPDAREFSTIKAAREANRLSRLVPGERACTIRVYEDYGLASQRIVAVLRRTR